MLYFILNVSNSNLTGSKKLLEQHLEREMEENQLEWEQEASEMTFEDYQVEAMSYRLPNANQIYALLNLAAEVGELVGKVAKHIRDGQPNAMKDEDYAEMYTQQVAKELGDVLWMCAAIADDLGISLGQVALSNLDKLYDRKQRDKLGGSGDER